MPENIERRLGIWLEHITKPQSEIGNYSICPFVKKMPPVITADKLDIEQFENLSDEVTIYCETEVNSTFTEIDELCKALNNKYTTHIFLPDHPHRETFIKGVKTGNGYVPLIIAQTKKELLSARERLSKTDYYSYWDKEYLEEIFNYGDMDRVG